MYEPAGGDAFVHYYIYGSFQGPLETSRAKYRTDGLPGSCTIQMINRNQNPEEYHQLLDPNTYLIKELKATNPDCLKKIEASKDMAVISGTISDPGDLNYMRDIVGVIMSLLDSGGVAVLDAQQWRWWTPDEFRNTMFTQSAPSPFDQVGILKSEDPDIPEAWWLRTVGLRKFGRPDINVHRVLPKYEDTTIKMLNRFIEMEVQGAIVPEGQEIRMKGLPAGMKCHHTGSVDDVPYNNTRIEIVWP